jgi:hypothetical protein
MGNAKALGHAAGVVDILAAQQEPEPVRRRAVVVKLQRPRRWPRSLRHEAWRPRRDVVHAPDIATTMRGSSRAGAGRFKRLFSV